MILQNQIAEIIDSQNNSFNKKEVGLLRHDLANIPINETFATIITGVRRGGKSTLLLQLKQKKYKDAIFINFEDIRLSNFEVSDFSRLQLEIEKRNINVLFFDEIQLIDKWEIYINQILREGYIVFITGSNASMLSKELGTNLTGRHLSMELFPFSYQEFIEFEKLKNDQFSLEKYLKIGGFPEFVKSKNSLILNNLLDDIIVRDIGVRNAIRDINSLKQLTVYLISNVGKPISANKITGLFGIKSTSTIIDYFSYLKDSYLFDFLPQFSYSIKAQARNPKKVYAVDSGLISEISASFSMDIGRKFENTIYMHFRRTNYSIFYYKKKGECDFVLFDKTIPVMAVQACYTLNDNNLDREINGLVEAMDEFKLTDGIIISFNQKDKLLKEGKTIKIIPAHEFLGKPYED